MNAGDLLLAEAVAAAGVEFIAVSFVRAADDVDQVRAVVGTRPQLVAKIQTSAAIEQLHEIIATSDVVMVPRRDFGIDYPSEDVPHLQKRIVRLLGGGGRSGDHGDTDVGVDDH